MYFKRESLKLYITKPKHSRYGSIPLDNPFKDIHNLIENSLIWFKKPIFEKPFIDIFGDSFCWRGWFSSSRSFILFKEFPEGDVKNYIYDKILNSIDSNFHETIKNRHYYWVCEVEVDFIKKENYGNFNLYLTKPTSIWDLQFAGIDRAKIFLYSPNLTNIKESHTLYYIEGKFFRKTKEFEFLCYDMWKSIKNSFNVPDDDKFLNNISDQNHKINQNSTEFLKIFFFDLNLKNYNSTK